MNDTTVRSGPAAPVPAGSVGTDRSNAPQVFHRSSGSRLPSAA
ncbi:hypothetical protein [Dactylosporangium matsuzakiense]|nr:hypothetical protein [Dactylosporangium matsuzakiense]